MERKYWVPALERAHEVIRCIAKQPSELRLIDLCALTSINKSSMFSLLHTMEALEWVAREKGDTYSLGATIAHLGNAYFSNMDIVQQFMQHAAQPVATVGETVQLARLEGEHIIYLAKREAPSPVRLLSEPGRRIPAYSTALGKVLLASKEDAEVCELLQAKPFVRMTSNTVTDLDGLLKQLAVIREQGYAIDAEEVAAGFCCIAASITDCFGRAVAAASFSIPLNEWEAKREAARMEILRFTQQMSQLV